MSHWATPPKACVETPDAPVGHGGLGAGRSRARARGCRRPRCPSATPTRSGANGATAAPDLVEPVGELGEPAGPLELLLEHGADQRGEEEGVGARADEEVRVGDLGGLGAPRIDDHQPAAARLQRLEPARHPGRGHHAAVGGERVGAEREEELGPVDVRDGHQQLVAEHRRGREMCGSWSTDVAE